MSHNQIFSTISCTSYGKERSTLQGALAREWRADLLGAHQEFFLLFTVGTLRCVPLCKYVSRDLSAVHPVASKPTLTVAWLDAIRVRGDLLQTIDPSELPAPLKKLVAPRMLNSLVTLLSLR